ncbi:glycosyltransferase [Derxia gummosa]|uniref:Glycosyltransferase n=1 Tax=Derxia gummosa DSM 723 TaxID=1121388 RepID=A0A8B6X256_9BURK|nr:glycosyltransferase [Derxia gummosa]
MRKIALVSEHASPLAAAGGVDSGGQNIYVAHVARELARRGWRVDVFTRKDRGFLPEVMHWLDGVRVIHVPAGPATLLPKEALLPFMPAFGEWMARFCAGAGYDLAHANFFMSGVAARIAARRLGIPLVITFHALGRVRRLHQGEADAFPPERGDIEQDLARAADLVIAECPQDEADLRMLYDADPARIEVVPCGFDPAEFGPEDRTAARGRLGWTHDGFTVLQLGRLVPRKGIDNVIEALGRLVHGLGVEARLCIVGGNSARANARATPEIARLQAIAAQAGVTGRVEFAGRRGRAELRDYYCASDVFVTTPWYEPFGITPVEAMACARPVIGADVGGIRSTVLDGITGHLVAPRDPDELARRLARLAAHPEVGHRMGLAGQARANLLYRWSNVAERLDEAYGRVLAAHRAPASAVQAIAGRIGAEA